MMSAVVVLLLACIVLSLGSTVPYKGCFSTSFVEQYASYYKFKQSLTLEQCIAACNSRLTRYMALETDKSSPHNHHVFCGNDLPEVSLKADDSQCSPSPENNTFLRGSDGTMSVYLLRGSTPLSLLLATSYGVEMLSDNKTTVRVAYQNTIQHQYIFYIYDTDLIGCAIGQSIPTFRSFYKYEPFTMKFSMWNTDYENANVWHSMGIDFLTGIIWLSTFDFTSVDPYNSTVVYLKKGNNKINGPEGYEYSLQHLHVDKINTLALDIHEMLVYATVTFTGDTSTYLVSLDYTFCHVGVLYHGPQLENATALEVFRDDAVWLRDVNGVTTVYYCKLTPKCELVTEYQSNQKIHDFTIYHPEKQTPGRKRLCANITCSHGCQQFSPFAAKCSCPPGVELGTDNSPCNGNIFTWVAPRAAKEPAGGFSTRYAANNSRTHSSSVTPLTQHPAPQAEAQPPSGSASLSTMEPMT